MLPLANFKFKNKQTDFYLLDKDLIFADRTENYDKQTSSIESFADNWFIGYIHTSCSQVQIRSKNTFLNLTGPTCIIQPPFSLVEWRIQPGTFKWYGIFVKNLNLELYNPRPRMKIWDQKFPLDKKALLQQIQSSDMEIAIETSKDNCALSEKVKQQIDQNFKEDLKIESIAQNLKVHRSFMCRSFKKTFGLSPIEYRHKLRVFEALKMMNQNHKDITYSALESGFASIQRFEEHFKKIFGITPKEFKF